MKAALLAIYLCIGAAPVFAAEHGVGNLSDHTGGVGHHKPAPAPLVGLGIPVALAVGGALLGAKFLNRPSPLIVFDYCRRLCHIRSAWREAVTEKGRAGRLGLAMRRRGRAQGWTD